MGDQAGVATQLAALLQRPAVLTAICAIQAPFFAGVSPATPDEGAALGRSGSKRCKRGNGPAQPPPPLPLTAEQATIASLQPQIASLEDVINSLRRELAKSRGEPAPTRPEADAAAPAASTTAAAKRMAAKRTPAAAAAAAGKAAASTYKAATTLQLAGQSHTERPKIAKTTPGASSPHPPIPMRVDWCRHGLAERGALRRLPPLVKASACPSICLLADNLGTGGHEDGPQHQHAKKHRRRRGGISSPAPPASRPRSLDLCFNDAVCCAGFLAGRGAGSGGCWLHHGSSCPGAAHGGSPLGNPPFNDSGEAAPPLLRRVPGRNPGVRHSPNHARSTSGRVVTALPRESSAMRGIGGLHSPGGPCGGYGRLTAHGTVQRVTALVHVQRGSKAAPMLPNLLQTLHCSTANLAMPCKVLQGMVRNERHHWETAEPVVVDAAPPGHILQLVSECLPKGEDRETADVLDVDPAR